MLFSYVERIPRNSSINELIRYERIEDSIGRARIVGHVMPIRRCGMRASGITVGANSRKNSI